MVHPRLRQVKTVVVSKATYWDSVPQGSGLCKEAAWGNLYLSRGIRDEGEWFTAIFVARWVLAMKVTSDETKI